MAVVKKWTDEAVCRAAADWNWVPDDAEAVVDYRLVKFPRWLGIGAIASSFDSNRPAQMLLEEVLEQASAWGQPSVGWWITAVTRPAELGPALVAARRRTRGHRRRAELGPDRSAAGPRSSGPNQRRAGRHPSAASRPTESMSR